MNYGTYETEKYWEEAIIPKPARAWCILKQMYDNSKELCHPNHYPAMTGVSYVTSSGYPVYAVRINIRLDKYVKFLLSNK